MRKARILAVDDQRYFRELLEGLLREEGYEVETVSSAEEALGRLDREEFDVVITDLVMPGVDGTELVGRIKERLPDQEIVMVTGVVDVKTAVEAMKQGATDYILKPFDRNTLASSLERILQRRRLCDEHARLMTENLEIMSVLSLYERACGLFSTLSVEPLAERLIEGLCVTTRAQGGVLWVAEEVDSQRLLLKGAHGIIRVEEEAHELFADRLGERLSGLLDTARSIVLPQPNGEPGHALFVALHFGEELVGLARLSDPLDGGDFGSLEQGAAEKFASLGATALGNALRFDALERRSLCDPNSQAYSHAFFQDAVRNEMQKADRFGRSFSLIHIDAGPLVGVRSGTRDAEFSRWLADLVEHLGCALRSTDLLASRDERRYDVLLPETDAVGAGVLKQRIRGLVQESEVLSAVTPDLGATLALAAATYPADGDQLESLEDVLEARLEADRASLCRTLSIEGQGFPAAIDQLLERGGGEHAAMSVEATRLLLREVARRPRDRGLLFLSPCESSLPVVRRGLDRLRELETKTEIVLVGEDPELSEEAGAVTCVSRQQVGTDRPFALYYGAGPVYAMVTAHRPEASGMRFFHTDDRSLVEYLAFQFQKGLGLPLGAQA